MKKFLIAAIATTLVASPILAAAPAEAQNRRVEQTERTVRQKPNGAVVVKQRTVTRQTARQPVRQSYRSNWRKGERFDRQQARNIVRSPTGANIRTAASMLPSVGSSGCSRATTRC